MIEETNILYKEENESNNESVKVKPTTSKSQDDATALWNLRTFQTFSKKSYKDFTLLMKLENKM